MICKNCGQEIEKFCEFPGQLCLNCHEIQFNKEQDHGTAEELAEQFKNLIIK